MLHKWKKLQIIHLYKDGGNRTYLLSDEKWPLILNGDLSND